MAEGENSTPSLIKEFSVILTDKDDREFDISDLVYTINIFQSIFNPVMGARLGIHDSTNFYKYLKGQEKVRIKFSPVFGEEFDCEFYVNSVDNIDIKGSLQTLEYEIWLVSPEGLDDYTTSVQKSYNGRISEAIPDIYKQFIKTDKKVTVEATNGNAKLIIPNLTPFQSIAFLAKRALSAQNGTDVFLSYETPTGFWFRTIADMIKKGKTRADRDENYQYSFSHTGNISPSEESTDYAVLSFKIEKKFTMHELWQAGYFAAAINRFNITTCELSQDTFELADEISNWTLLESTPIQDKKFLSSHRTSHRQYLLFEDPEKTEPPIGENIAKKAAYYANLLQNQFEIKINMNTKIEAGDVIKIDIPEIEEFSEIEENSFYSGYFLVAEVDHFILNKSTAITRLICYKDSYR